MAIPWGAIATGARIAAPLIGGLMGDGSVRARENNFAQNAENAHWFRVQQDRLDESYRIQRGHDTDQMEDQYREQFGWLVEGAQKAGFNPLTVLGKAGVNSGGGGGVANMPLANQQGDGNNMGRALSDTIGAAADLLDPIDQERRRLENELLEKRIKQIDNEGARLGKVPQLRKTTSKVDESIGPDVNDPDWQGPLNHPSNTEYPRIRVRLPSGDEVNMLKEHAERLRIDQGDMLMAEDLTALLGEIPGEIANTLTADSTVENLMQSGLLTSSAYRKKKKANADSKARKRKSEGRSSVRW